jgi:DNA polymerase-3 subunit gamma/tau
MSYLVLARKWRPKNFDDLTGQETIAKILKNAINSGKVAHAYIFSGPRGVGKTSTARILAKALNCEKGPTGDPCGTCPSCLSVSEGSSVDVSEIDGASNTGVDNIRDLRERVRYAPSGARYKIYIIDEAHMLSTSAFNALLKTLEEPPPNVIFVLATTEPKKIPPTVLSRCQHLPFRRIAGQKIKERLKHIAGSEGIKISDSALEMIARAADGGMRDSLTMLDQIISFSEDITANDVSDLLGITDIQTISGITEAVINGNRKSIIKTIAELTDTGTDLKAFTKDMLQFIRNLLITSIVIDPSGIIDLSEEEASAISSLCKKSSEEHIALILSELIKAEPSIRNAAHPRVALEMTLIRLSLLSSFSSINDALKAIAGGTASNTNTTPANVKKTEISAAKQLINVPYEVRQNASASADDKLSLSEIWQSALNNIDNANHSLSALLKDSKSIFSDNKITIVCGSDFHSEGVKENLMIIKDAVRSVSGKNIEIVIETAKAPALTKKELKEQALENPIVKEALELFEGRIVDVIPHPPSAE